MLRPMIESDLPDVFGIHVRVKEDFITMDRLAGFGKISTPLIDELLRIQ